jgi:hypothetical protein
VLGGFVVTNYHVVKGHEEFLLLCKNGQKIPYCANLVPVLGGVRQEDPRAVRHAHQVSFLHVCPDNAQLNGRAVLSKKVFKSKAQSPAQRNFKKPAE